LFYYFRQLDEIIRDTTPPAYGEEHLAALTAGERPLWAEARETYFRAGANRSSLEAIERSAFVLILDDEEFEIGTVSSFHLKNSFAICIRNKFNKIFLSSLDLKIKR
jgi:carnitine O-palmitoyltransferase 1